MVFYFIIFSCYQEYIEYAKEIKSKYPSNNSHCNENAPVISNKFSENDAFPIIADNNTFKSNSSE